MTKHQGNAWLHEVFCELRGMPDKCDWCDSPKSAEELDPVSGGEWICEKCAEELLKPIAPAGAEGGE